MDWLPVLALLVSFGPGVIIAFLAEDRTRLRTALNMGAAVAQLLVVAALLTLVAAGHNPQFTLPFLAGMSVHLHTDALSLLLAGLSAVLWLVTTPYAIGYLEDSPNRSRFFGFFSLCVTATTGVALAGNLFTLFVFYELLTLATYPLVVHRGTPEAREAAQVYLGYTLSGGLAALVGMVWLQQVAGPVSFMAGGRPEMAGIAPGTLTAIFVLLVGGFGVKAALVPLHGWLPIAMVAPAPVSALLHAVAVVKVGAFAVVRVVEDVFGLALLQIMGLAPLLAGVAAFTILYGSVRALSQDYLKRRLAYSTVSQVAYIILGATVAGSVAVAGGLVHLVHQGLMKITLFFCAGNYAETLEVHRVRQMNGIGRRMPATTTAFTVGALGMVGAPPLAGFITKWTMGRGALLAGEGWVVAVLAASTLLNAAYFLPILYRAWFLDPDGPWPARQGRGETSALLLWPPLITAALAALVGILASMPISPLQWAFRIADMEFGL
jgi:multicomponent Na+:H+ antiporter subunit D